MPEPETRKVAPAVAAKDESSAKASGPRDEARAPSCEAVPNPHLIARGLKLGELLLVSTGVLYALGYFVNSVYLAGTGVPDADLLRADCILRGAMAAAVFVAPLLLLIPPSFGEYLYQGASRKPRWRRWLRAILGTLGAGVVVYFAGGYFLGYIRADGTRDLLKGWTLVFGGPGTLALLNTTWMPFILAWALVSDIAWVEKKRLSGTLFGLPRIVKGLLILFIIPTPILWVFAYTDRAYTQIDARCGGGSPVVTTILLSPDGRSIAGALGLTPSGTGRLTGVLVIHETDNDYYIRRDKAVVRLPKRLTEGSVVRDDARPETVVETQPATSPAAAPSSQPAISQPVAAPAGAGMTRTGDGPAADAAGYKSVRPYGPGMGGARTPIPGGARV